MRYSPWLLTVVLAAMVGCSSEPRPAAGMAGLRVNVAAKPKTGTGADRPSVYDSANAPSGTGSFEHVDYSDLGNIVVWAEPAGTKPAVRPGLKPVTIPLTVGGTPDVLTGVACVGQTIRFKNNGIRGLSAYSVSDGNQFNLGTIGSFGEANYVPNSAGLIEVLTDGSQTPVATVYVASTCPVFLTKSGATLDFTDLAPGHYLVVSWHPRLPGSVHEVDLVAGRVAHVTINVGVNGLPKIDGK